MFNTISHHVTQKYIDNVETAINEDFTTHQKIELQELRKAPAKFSLWK